MKKFSYLRIEEINVVHFDFVVDTFPETFLRRFDDANDDYQKNDQDNMFLLVA